MILISILILFFILLLTWQVIITSYSLKEGLANTNTNNNNNSRTVTAVYQPYNSDALLNNATALPKQNASNIDYLNGIVLRLNNSNTKNEQSINAMQTQIDALTQQQVEYATSIVTSEPAEE